MYCIYYQAHVPPRHCWFVLAILKSFEHVCLSRTLDQATSMVEFFVPSDMHGYFQEVMSYLVQEQLVTNLTILPNRLVT